MSYLKHKPGSIEELMANEASKLNDNAYQDMFKKELDKAGKGIGGMSPKEKKDFFNKIDSKYKAKNEELSAAQKKLPPALQKAIAKKMSDKKEDTEHTHDDGTKHTHADGDKEHTHDKDTKDEGFASDAQRKAAFASGYKEKDKKEDLGKEDDSIVKAVVGQLKKAVKAHDSQAKDLEKAMKTEADQHGDEINDKKKEASKKGEKEPKKLNADTGTKMTKVETEPSVDYKN